MSEWQVIDTAPKDGTVIWLFSPGTMRLGRWQNNRWADFCREEQGLYRNDVPCDWGSGNPPTHWMHPPKPPKGA